MNQRSDRDVVITGLGMVSSLGIGSDAFWKGLHEQRSGIQTLPDIPPGSMPNWIGGKITRFDPKDFIPRKNLKLMSIDIQLAVAAADLAMKDSQAVAGSFDPERAGVVFGCDMIQSMPHDVEGAYRGSVEAGRFRFDRFAHQAMSEIFPLWFLKHLPNMPACHIAIIHDMRGPNNTMSEMDVSSALSIIEAARYIQRGDADLMICGGVGSKLHPTPFCRSFIGQVSRRNETPELASRPFDADRDGGVMGEGAAAIVIESRASAQARGARIIGRLLGTGRTFAKPPQVNVPSGTAMRTAMAAALREAQMQPAEIGHVNAHGQSTPVDDPIEAEAIRDVLGQAPVTAPKSYFGQAAAGGAALELAASLLGMVHGEIPVTLNYRRPDPACPVNVIHGEPAVGLPPTMLKLSFTPYGQAAALIVGQE